MNRSVRRRVRTAVRHLLNRHRPMLERMESRLPPGDALLGILLAWPALGPETRELDPDVVSGFDWEAEDAPAFAISRPKAVPKAYGFTATPVEPTSESTKTWAAGLSPAVRTTGINPAARYSISFDTSEIASDVRAAGLIPAVYTAGINPVARNIVRTLTNHVPGLPMSTESTDVDLTSDAQNSEVMNDYGKLPLAFEANHGQTDSRVDFITRTGGATVFLTPTAAVFSIENSDSRIQSEPEAFATRADLASVANASRSERSAGIALHMELVGGNPYAQAIGGEQLPGIVNYFIGNDPSQWHANVPTFGRVEYQEVYPGIDLVYYGNDGQLEYDFIVSPGADPNAITLNFARADGVEINSHGDLVLHMAAGDSVQQKPFTYQEVGETRQEVASHYIVDGTQVRFEVEAYDATQELVIDPLVLEYSTYLGGSRIDTPYAIAVDQGGHAHVAGNTVSLNFPTTPGAYQTQKVPSSTDAFVTKLKADGSGLVYSTYLGGNGEDAIQDMTLDRLGNAYLTGSTGSHDFPTTPGAFQIVNGDFLYRQGFLTNLTASGAALGYSTYFGGLGNGGFGGDYPNAVAIDRNGSAYVFGHTEAEDFPTTPGAFDVSMDGGQDAFLTKFTPDASALAFSTFLGGEFHEYGFCLALDRLGRAYVAGTTLSPNFPTTSGAYDATYNGSGLYYGDGFVTRVASDGSALGYSTLIGGGDGDYSASIALDYAGAAYVAGTTLSLDFPTTPGVFDTALSGTQDGFVVKLNPSGAALVYSTYIGGGDRDNVSDMGVERLSGTVYVAGGTYSADFPTTAGSFQPVFGGGASDGFVAKLNSNASGLAYSSYLGGSDFDSGYGLALDSLTGQATVIGVVQSSNFPTTSKAFDKTYNGSQDGFVAKVVES